MNTTSITKDQIFEIYTNTLFAHRKLDSIAWMLDGLASSPHQFENRVFIGICELIKENAEHVKSAYEVLDLLSSLLDDDFLREKETERLQRVKNNQK